MRHNGQDRHQVTSLGGFATFPDFSPDGRRIVFDANATPDAPDQIFVVGADGSGLRQLTQDSANDGFAAWSPDGRKIAFISDRTGIGQLFVMNADGSGVTPLTRDGRNHGELPDWSPNGRQIAYETDTRAGARIFVMNADGTAPHRITNGGGTGDDLGPAWSPDGTKIAFVRALPDQPRTVYVARADGSSARPLLHSATNQLVPAWQPLGTAHDVKHSTAAAAGALAAAGGCDAHAVTSYPPPSGTDGPFGVTQGPGGTWYAEGATVNRIGRRLTRVPVPDAERADLGWLSWDGGHLVWFADRGTGRLGSVDPHGGVREWQLPDGINGPASPNGVVARPTGPVWFTDPPNDRVGRLDPTTGTITTWQTPTSGSWPLGLTFGPDGNLWFTERSVDQVARVTRSGDITEWPLTPGAFPNRIVAGPDGALWFTELGTNQVARITTGGVLTEFPVAGGPVGITVSRSGQMYVALYTARQVGALSTTGTITRTWDVPGALQVAASRDSVWATDTFSNSVARIRVHC
jgi:virginiamycin B lyase